MRGTTKGRASVRLAFLSSFGPRSQTYVCTKACGNDRKFMQSRFNDVTLLTIQRAYYGSVQLSFRPHFDHSGFGNDASPRGRRRDAASALASPALLGARHLGCEPVSVFGGGMVDFLSLAQPATMDLF